MRSHLSLAAPCLVTLVSLVSLVTLAACSAENSRRNEECVAFADWSNKLAQPVGAAGLGAGKAAETGHDRASSLRKLALGARTTAQTPFPFKDPFVKDLAIRRRKVFEAVAVALDHEADASDRGDKNAQSKAFAEEQDASKYTQDIMEVWLNNCRLP